MRKNTMPINKNTKLTPNVGDALFGVTHHHIVIKMQISSIVKVDDYDYSEVHVMALDLSDKYAETHARLSFKDLLLIDGEINKERVFTDEADAKGYALKKLTQEEDVLLQKLENLRCTKHKLQA